MEKESLYISFLSWFSSSFCWWHQNKLWFLGKGGIMDWIRCLFQLWTLVYSGACNHFCSLHDIPPPSLISSCRRGFPHALPSISVCVESVPAIDGVGNARKGTDSELLIKPNVSWKMGPGGLGIKHFSALLQTWTSSRSSFMILHSALRVLKAPADMKALIIGKRIIPNSSGVSKAFSNWAV